ncbi:MAG: sterol-binding protein [Gammaproteobacteria bacterium]|nr:sterol-binding protein [Gammaproteobacteria bacterium]
MAFVPQRIHGSVLATGLNQMFAPELRDGELDFMNNRVVAFHVRDIGLDVRIGLGPGGFCSIPSTRQPELTMKGNLYDFLLLATRKEDPDTLFFHRRLRLEGDTELGLYLKNFLDGLDLDPARLPLPVKMFIRHSVPLYNRLFMFRRKASAS